jgi:glycine hydroxymethyltransferase
MYDPLSSVDPEVAEAIQLETRRESETVELIASENSVSEAVLEAMGSILTNKYAEGYSGRRYYGGCEYVDVVEELAIKRAKALFGAEHANVQPHSGTQANLGAYLAVLRPGDTILGMDLAHGGHLTHGSPLNFSGMFFRVVPYGVRRDNEEIDYEVVADLAQREKPRLIVAGASAYSRTIRFDILSEIAKKAGAYLLVDMAHIAGLVAAGVHPSPVPHADLVTTTTHKTLRGPRGGMVLCRNAHRRAVDKLVFPGVQGGPLMHIIAAKAVCFKEALAQDFKDYQRQVVRNAQAMCLSIQKRGWRVVSGGTDNHLFMVDVFSKGITGRQAQDSLERAGITVNKNTIPFDVNPPAVASGIRVGTPTVTTRGMKEPEMEQIAEWVTRVLEDMENESLLAAVRAEVRALAARFPLYAQRLAAR